MVKRCTVCSDKVTVLGMRVDLLLIVFSLSFYMDWRCLTGKLWQHFDLKYLGMQNPHLLNVLLNETHWEGQFHGLLLSSIGIMKLQNWRHTYRKCYRISEDLEVFLIVMKFIKIKHHTNWFSNRRKIFPAIGSETQEEKLNPGKEKRFKDRRDS